MAHEHESLIINEAKSVYGIKKIKCNGHISLQSAICAPNGIFKTSFARVLNSISDGKVDEIEDRITHDCGTLDIQIIDRNGKRIESDSAFMVYSRSIEGHNICLDTMQTELQTLAVSNEVKAKVNSILDTHGVTRAVNSLRRAFNDLRLKYG